MLETDVRDKAILQRFQNMVLDDGLPIATAEFLLQPPEKILNSLFKSGDKISDLVRIMRARDEAGLIDQVNKGLLDGLLAALYENFMNVDECISAFDSLIKTNFTEDEGWTEEDNNVINAFLIISGITAFNAMRAGLISTNLFFGKNRLETVLFVNTWIHGNQEYSINSNLIILRKYCNYLTDWKESGATSKSNLKERLESLEPAIQLAVVQKSFSIECAELLTAICKVNPEPSIRNFNLNEAELKSLGDYPPYGKENYEALINNIYLGLGIGLGNMNRPIALALLQKSIDINDLKSLIDSYSGKNQI